MAELLYQSEELTLSTVRIVCDLDNGETSIGTGFFFDFPRGPNQAVYTMVTNTHVIKNSHLLRFQLRARTPDGGPNHKEQITFSITCKASSWILHPDPTVDLALLPIGQFLESTNAEGKLPYFITLGREAIPSEDELRDLGAVEDLLMVGYPIGLWDSVNNLPIVRRGITATHPTINYDGDEEFLIDAACFPGSSGSPVFLYNPDGWAQRNGSLIRGQSRIRLVGVLYASPKRNAKGGFEIENIPTHQGPIEFYPINLGYVIKAHRLLEFDDVLKRREKRITSGGV